ncbi:O-antigen ligase family protein [Aetokthonos hydrillicola Thurmond2011]|jgi:O-antigen ligase|uniref:O-antigen ligase family protein n=1 Tax=Aetokthonos hydrillicola Thurmond2011 TaxID=2712845 RepID=A0AAP5I617_9CYAN|nr:O-antigen ligase family protein [Aetokthonos hydrillicola]MBO3460960.1 O-antigen ligase family protein [Aetokthonos hydrillicola CCALA 1050]MBW4583633.1 O-antigen ligase family protein [Aetokthonos hydrillicola CCALA 1050]MDR9895672.1 O-antigen ligase family protein [Aetokthonos hydrillicola Thurmond2011]
MKSIKKIDKIATIILLMLAVGIFQPHPRQDLSLDPYGGSLVSTLNNIGSYVFIMILMTRHWKSIIYTSTRNIPLLLLVGLISVSILWSADPQQTLEYSKGIWRIYLTGAYLSWQYSVQEQMWMLSLPLGLAALSSLIVYFLFPFYGVSEIGLSGIYGHKTVLGANMALSAGIFLHLALSNRRYWWILWPGFGLSVVVLLLSKSATAVSILAAFIVLLIVYKLIQSNQYKLQVIFISFAILLIFTGSIWSINHAETLVATQGKDLSLTGRTPLWSDLMVKIQERPFLGYGFGGFWGSAESINIKADYPWASGSHNGFIEIGLYLGLLGFTIFVISFFQSVLKGLSEIVLCAKTWEDFWPMQSLVYLFMLSCSEGLLFVPYNVYWLLYVTISLSLYLEPRRRNKKTV